MPSNNNNNNSSVLIKILTKYYFNYLLHFQMHLVYNHPFMEEVFREHSHHFNLSLIFTSQNYFGSSKNQTIRRNCTYKFIFNDRADKTLMRNISLQICPSYSSFLSHCFKKLEKLFPNEKHAYVLIDSTPTTEMSRFTVRSHVLPDEITKKITPICFFFDDED